MLRCGGLKNGTVAVYRYRGTFEFESEVDGLRDEYNKSIQKLHTHKNGGREGRMEAGRQGGREGRMEGR